MVEVRVDYSDEVDDHNGHVEGIQHDRNLNRSDSTTKSHGVDHNVSE
jgi:hypothetical protein